MTNIAYIRGLPADAATTDAPRTITAAPALDPLQMTRGEFRVSLLLDQLRILGEYYGDAAQLAEVNRLKDLLAKGLHNAPGAGSTIPAINKAIRRAQRLNQPAAKVFIRENRAAGLTDAVLSGITGQASIGEVLIPFYNCDQFIEYEPENQNDPYGPQVPKYLDGYAQCKKSEEYVTILNNKLTPSSHHLLYEYAAAFGEPGAVTTKRVLHRNAISSISNISGLHRDDLRQWIRTAIMRNNTQNGTNPWQPEDTYYILRTGSTESSINGVPLAAVLAAVAKVVAAITGAVAATVGLINALKNPDKLLLQNAAQGIGTPTFGPEQGDFLTAPGAQDPAGTQTSKILLPAAAAAAVLLLAK